MLARPFTTVGSASKEYFDGVPLLEKLRVSIVWLDDDEGAWVLIAPVIRSPATMMKRRSMPTLLLCLVVVAYSPHSVMSVL